MSHTYTLLQNYYTASPDYCDLRLYSDGEVFVVKKTKRRLYETINISKWT